MDNHDGDGSNSQPNEARLHPLIDDVFPVPLSSLQGSSTLLGQEIKRYEEELNADMTVDLHLIRPGVDLSRYSAFTSEDGDINYENLYSTLSYASMQQRLLSLALQNTDSIKASEDSNLESLKVMKEDYSSSLHQKRRQIDDFNLIRKKRQVVEFGPVNEYLNERWKDGIRSAVDLGIEASKIDLDI